MGCERIASEWCFVFYCDPLSSVFCWNPGKQVWEDFDTSFQRADEQAFTDNEPEWLVIDGWLPNTAGYFVLMCVFAA